MSKVISLEKIRPIVEQIVERKLLELFGDPDEGLELKPSVRKRLKRTLSAKEKGISAEKVSKELGLEW